MNNTGKPPAAQTPVRERRRRGDRRDIRGRRASDAPGRLWLQPAWSDQRLQFITRYVFAFMAVIYFNFVFPFQSTLISLTEFNLFLASYAAWVTLTLLHARRNPGSHLRVRLTMWGDIVGVSVAVIADPFVAPLSSLVYIVIVLGNGMRYGMRMFSEALAGTFAAALAAFAVRYTGTVGELSPGVVFLNIFAASILVYAYILMRRVDESRRALELTSRTDPLTGLMNRAALKERSGSLIAEACAGGPTASLLFVDLDKFKQVNDTLGHARGDQVLRTVARLLRANIREGDIAARYGGDEFVVLLCESNLEQARAISERLQRKLAEWTARENIEVHMTIGIGVAPTHGRDLDSLLEQVDSALYRSKAAGELGGVCCAPV